jgi:cellulose synthase/poly-beta-1,6-N-acetylglucosamine synthase-like glycosyltransferase
MTNEYVIIEKRELGLKKWEIYLNIDDAQKLLEIKDVILKFFDKWIHSIQTSLAKWEMMGKENEAYIAQRVIGMLKKDIESIQTVYKEFLDKEAEIKDKE